MIDLSVIVVNYNNDRVLRDCLPSLQEGVKDLCAEVIISDNGSADGSVDWIRESFPDFRILENRANLGFAEANNRAIRIARGKCLLLLNPDTIVLDRAVCTMVEFLNDNRHVGIVGCKLLNHDRSRQISARGFPTLSTNVFHMTGLAYRYPQHRRFGGFKMTFWDGDTPRSVDWVSGAALMMRREVLERAGELDPRFFLTFDEIDFCKRTWNAGLEVWYIPDAVIVHLDRQSEPQSNPKPEARIKYLTVERNSRVHYFRKHHGLVYAALIELTHLALAAAFLIKATLFGTNQPPIYVMEQRLLIKLYVRTIWRIPRAICGALLGTRSDHGRSRQALLFVNPYLADD